MGIKKSHHHKPVHLGGHGKENPKKRWSVSDQRCCLPSRPRGAAGSWQRGGALSTASLDTPDTFLYATASWGARGCSVQEAMNEQLGWTKGPQLKLVRCNIGMGEPVTGRGCDGAQAAASPQTHWAVPAPDNGVSWPASTPQPSFPSACG